MDLEQRVQATVDTCNLASPSSMASWNHTQETFKDFPSPNKELFKG